MLEYLVYIFLKGFAFFFRILPFSIIYIVSDLFFLGFFTIGRYRTGVVMQNLTSSFPEKSRKENRKIMKLFYHHLMDLLVESLKAFSMKEEAVVRRYRFRGTEQLEQFYREGRSVICVAGHFNNWEWSGAAAGSQLVHKPVGFYQPLSNRYIDAYVQRSRIRGRSVLASITRTSESFKTDWGEPAIYFMIADQSPTSPRLAYWMDFLNQDTAVLHGPEKYARIHDMPLVYADVQKIRRGYYEVNFECLEANPATTKTGELTGRFMKRLERAIIRDPQYYLWSHRRWKLKREKKGA